MEKKIEILNSQQDVKIRDIDENMQTIKKTIKEFASPLNTTAKKNPQFEDFFNDVKQEMTLTDSTEYFEKKSPFSKNFNINFTDSVSKIPKKLNQNAIVIYFIKKYIRINSFISNRKKEDNKK